MIPPFEVKRAHAAVSKYLRESVIPTMTTRHSLGPTLRSHRSLRVHCLVIGNHNYPWRSCLGTLPYFSAVVRRVYLSATLPHSTFRARGGRERRFQIAPKPQLANASAMILMHVRKNLIFDDVQSNALAFAAVVFGAI